jgi:NAD(P)-dependent dehydrogenase (short-subunit alcohol dehydrogenase family)
MPARAGARVAIVDIQAERGVALARAIGDEGGRALFIEADASDAAAVADAVGRATAAFGPVTRLFNHAGTIVVKPLHRTTDEDYDRLMRIFAHLIPTLLLFGYRPSAALIRRWPTRCRRWSTTWFWRCGRSPP